MHMLGCMLVVVLLLQVQGPGAADRWVSPGHKHRHAGQRCGAPVCSHHGQDAALQGGRGHGSREPGAAKHPGARCVLGASWWSGCRQLCVCVGGWVGRGGGCQNRVQSIQSSLASCCLHSPCRVLVCVRLCVSTQHCGMCCCCVGWVLLGCRRGCAW